MAPLPLSLRTYRLATAMLEPVAPALLQRRVRRGKECPARLSERLGRASRARPEGTLIWIHAASVGECLSVLPLIEALTAPPGRSVLLTSGTVTSATLMAERLPARAMHQFAPVDTPAAVTRFLAHWRPDVALFVDSEIWPNILMTARDAGVPLAIVNGRMTDKSYSGWLRARSTAARLFALYDTVLAQDEMSAKKFAALGARSVVVSGSLKADAEPLPAKADVLAALQRAIGERPIFLATNTHPGEERMLLSAHDVLLGEFPALLTIIAPRHPERGAEIVEACAPRDVACRSRGEQVDSNTALYVADTMGELGLFYRLATFAFVGKSLAGEGGQNPLEPARLGVAVLAGPHTENFAEAYDAIFTAQGFGRIATADGIAPLAARLLADPARARTSGQAAARAVQSLGGALARTRDAIEELIRRHARA